VIFIGAFIPKRDFGLFDLQGLTLLVMYLVGVTVAIPIAWLLKKTLLRGPTPPFVMEMPGFKVPGIRVVLMRVLERGKAFLVRAGTVIFAVTIIMWALLYYPHVDGGAATGAQHSRFVAGSGTDAENALAAEQISQSFLGRAGRFIEPAVRPLGWDWKIAVATLASFPAREVIVSTLGTIYHLGNDQDAESVPLKRALQEATYESGPRSGDKIITPLVAIGIMVFFALCCQCAATLAVIRRETASWRWPIFAFSYMTALAYAGALLVYQGGHLLGLASA
jgi:ferrous iron transport protein B